MVCKIAMTDDWHYVKNASFAGFSENPLILAIIRPDRPGCRF